jgi:glycosyltransferase involved in cell wall biosynthesis
MLSMSKRKVLILITSQFGYHTDTFMYCKYLDRTKFDVSYFCFDMGLPRIVIRDVSVYYVPSLENRVLRYIVFVRELRQIIKKQRFDIIFHVYTLFALIIRIVTLKHFMVLDIRTGNVSNNKLKRKWKNFQITYSAWFYPRISVISESLADKLSINRQKRSIIPLGGEWQQIPDKKIEAIKLLYIGILDKRNIHETVYGLSLFVKQYENLDVSYDIIGSGSEQATDLLLKSITETGLFPEVNFHGRRTLEELLPYFETCNVGVVYIPQTDYYDTQPSTKLYECLLAGMPVIATNTYENRIAIKGNTGELCEDNPESFCEALIRIYKNKSIYQSQEIKQSVQENTWENIVRNKLAPYLLS